MSKSADAFRTISEVADWLDTPTHVLRFWESKFWQIKPVKRAGGRRYYRRQDMLLIGGIKQLLHQDGLTIKGAQKILREKGAKHVSSLSQPHGIQRDQLKAENITEKLKKQDKAADWQSLQISDFATNLSESNTSTLMPFSEKENVDLSLESIRSTASQSSESKSTEDDVRSHTVPITATVPDDASKSNDASEEPVKQGINSKSANKDLPDKLLATNGQGEKPKMVFDGGEHFEKNQSSFEDDQTVLDFWADDKLANEPDASPPNKTLSETAPLVEPKHGSVMTHLSLYENIEKNKAALLEPILFNLEKLLQRRQTRPYKWAVLSAIFDLLLSVNSVWHMAYVGL